MPLFIAILVVLVFMGGISDSTTSSGPVSESDVIIRTPSGGVAHNTKEEADNIFTPSITISNPIDTPNVTTGNTPTAPSAPVVEVPPVLDTISAQDVTASNATLRGNVSFVGEPYNGKLYFVYSDKASDVRSLASNIAETPVYGSVGNDGVYTRSVSYLNDETTYYYRICFDANVTTCGDVASFTTVEGYGYSSTGNYRAPYASTQRAENIQGEFVTLKGTYYLYDSEYNTAFFVYGEDWNLINEVTDYRYYNSVDEDGDNLQKIRVKSNMTEDGDFEKEIDDLETSTTYYYRFCLAYDDDEESGITCGSTQSFVTKSSQKDIPEVRSTQGSRNGDGATLSAVIDMEDYRNGHAFVVYGTDETRVNYVTDLDEFDYVYQYGDSLQRVSLDDDLDNTETVSVTLDYLLNETYFYLFCVEYEAENDYGWDDLFLACGDVSSL